VDVDSGNVKLADYGYTI